MNSIIARVLGEATEEAAEERQEVALAKQIVAAAEAGDKERVVALAKQLIKMHQRKPERRGLVGEISPSDFQSGLPFRGHPSLNMRDPQRGIRNIRDLD